MLKKNDMIQPMLRKYKQLIPLYKQLAEEIEFTLRKKLDEKNVNIAALISRHKDFESFKEKIERKNYEKPFEENEDFAGTRVVCLYEHELDVVSEIIKNELNVLRHMDKTDALGTDKMGYQGAHFIVCLKENYEGARYEGLKGLKCEIQIRTVLQDAWSLISHHLVYKNESSIPVRLKRDLNNVASLLEIAQSVFNAVFEKRTSYIKEIHDKENKNEEFLSQPIDHETLIAFTKWKYPNQPISEHWNSRLIADLNLNKYKKLGDINQAIDFAKLAVEAYRKEAPEMFKTSTAFLTKSIGFVDEEFRDKHPFGEKTREAFNKYSHLVKTKKTT